MNMKKKESKAEGGNNEAKPIVIVRFPRNLELELFYMQMDSIMKDLKSDYHVIVTKDVEGDKVEFELLKPKFTGETIEQLQHRVLVLIDPEYKGRLEKMEYYKTDEK